MAERSSERGRTMTGLLRFSTDGEDPILVEVTEPLEETVTRGGRAETLIVDAGESLDRVLARLGPVTKGVVAELRATADWPDEVEIEFAVKLSADSNVIIARAGGEANFRIVLRWTRDQRT
jgi:hypothetical protein